MELFSATDDNVYEDSTFNEISLEDLSLERSRFFSVVFDHCVFRTTLLNDSAFQQVIFKDCDLSEARFDTSLLKNCTFTDCKLLASSFASCSMEQCKFTNCNFSYANLDGLRMKKGNTFARCKLEEAGMSNGALGTTHFAECDLTRVSLMNTPLRGIDLSSCTLDGIMVSENHHELTGLVISSSQAPSIAALLGVIVSSC